MVLRVAVLLFRKTLENIDACPGKQEDRKAGFARRFAKMGCLAEVGVFL